MSEDWTAGSRPVLTPAAPPALVVIADDDNLAADLADAASEPNVADLPIEVRATVTGPTRTPDDLVAEVVFVIGQLGLGAAGNAVFAAIQHLWTRLRHPRHGTPPRETRISLVLPTKNGEARVETVILGDDPKAAHESLVAIMQSYLPKTDD